MFIWYKRDVRGKKAAGIVLKGLDECDISTLVLQKVIAERQPKVRKMKLF